MRAAGRAAVVVAGSTTASVAYAHHSFAMFDSDHQIKVAGTVKHFQWTNPHVYIEMDGKNVKDDKAQEQHYTIECASPGILTRIGWKFNMVKPGDTITVIIAPSAHRRARRAAEADHAFRTGASSATAGRPASRISSDGGARGDTVMVELTLTRTLFRWLATGIARTGLGPMRPGGRCAAAQPRRRRPARRPRSRIRVRR